MKDPQLPTKARLFATRWHGNQMYGDKPYAYHLAKAQSVLLWMGVEDLEAHAAILCHDILEDTPCKYAELKDALGERVAELVWAVTNERGRDRKESLAKTYPKMVALPDAITIKLADRIANVEESIRDPRWAHMLEKYAGEQPGFAEHLFDLGGLTIGWAYLDSILAGGSLREGA